MKVMNILHDSVVDGPGLRTVVFFAGCPHQCLGCHNPASWKMTNGVDMSVEEIFKEIKGNPLRSEEHTSELQSRGHLVCRLLLANKTISPETQIRTPSRDPETTHTQQ